MPNTFTRPEQSPKPDYNAPTFRGALASDRWMNDDDPEFSKVHSSSIAEVSRAASAIAQISRIVHNSLNEPACSGVEPLGLSAHLALLDGLEIIGRYLGDLGESMREMATISVKSDEHESAEKRILD